MSRAFVKESDTIDVLPDRPVSQHPNYVTAEGLAKIDAEYERLSNEYAQAQLSADRDAMARIARDLRYWQQRQASAQVIPPRTDKDEIGFGSTVTILRDDGRQQVWHIVGEDEADPVKGSLSYVSPLARALVGKKVGDVVQMGTVELEIIDIQ